MSGAAISRANSGTAPSAKEETLVEEFMKKRAALAQAQTDQPISASDPTSFVNSLIAAKLLTEVSLMLLATLGRLNHRRARSARSASGSFSTCNRKGDNHVA
jgi:hypothetical protein